MVLDLMDYGMISCFAARRREQKWNRYEPDDCSIGEFDQVIQIVGETSLLFLSRLSLFFFLLTSEHHEINPCLNTFP